MPRCSDPECGRWRPERSIPGLRPGFRLNGAWYCSRECLDGAARLTLAGVGPRHASTPLPPPRLGALLRHQRAITGEQLTRALTEQRFSGLKLGAQLRALGMASGETVLRGLAVQNGISYLSSLDLTRVRGGCPLPAATVRALGLVPFDFDGYERRVSVAVIAPLARAAVRAMGALTAWTIEPYLVDDSVWSVALAAYRPSDAGDARSATASSARELAEHMAAVGMDGHAVTMRHTQYDDRTWVRLESSHQTRDVVLEQEGAGLCPEQPTAR